MLRRWNDGPKGKLLLRVGQVDRLISEKERVRVDRVVGSVVVHMEELQSEDGFRQAISEYSGVQGLLNRLAGAHHVRWATAVLEAAPPEVL